MWEYLLPGLREATERQHNYSRRKNNRRLRPNERGKGPSLSGAERQKAYQARFIAKYGADAWKRVIKGGEPAEKVKAEVIRAKQAAASQRYRERFIQQHGVEAWNERKRQSRKSLVAGESGAETRRKEAKNAQNHKQRFIEQYGEEAWKERRRSYYHAKRSNKVEQPNEEHTDH